MDSDSPASPGSPDTDPSGDTGVGPAAQATSTPAQPAPPRRSFLRRHWLAATLAVLLGVPAVGMTAWAWLALSITYSSGKRAGYVQKISRKGWLCKTWEGTLYTDIAQGFRSDSFAFTVRKDSIAHLLEQLSGRRVAVDYEQHVGVPSSCFGETEYFVVGVTPLND